MIHQWFMHFGGVAILLALVSYFGTRTLANRSRNSDDKQGAAFGTIALGIFGAIALFVAFALVCLGISGAIAGWIGVTLLGVAAGLGSRV